MAEQKRHTDVPQERFLESPPQSLPPGGMNCQSQYGLYKQKRHQPRTVVAFSNPKGQ